MADVSYVRTTAVVFSEFCSFQIAATTDSDDATCGARVVVGEYFHETPEGLGVTASYGGAWGGTFTRQTSISA